MAKNQAAAVGAIVRTYLLGSSDASKWLWLVLKCVKIAWNRRALGQKLAKPISGPGPTEPDRARPTATERDRIRGATVRSARPVWLAFRL